FQGGEGGFDDFYFFVDGLNSLSCFHITDSIFMLSETRNPNPALTSKGMARWLAAAQARLLHLAQTPGTSLGHLEIALVEELRSLGQPLLTVAALAQAQATA